VPQRKRATSPAPASSAAISRPELSKQVVGNPEALRRLEALVHPLVAAEKARWLRAQAAAGLPLVVLDVPLLFETGGQAQCDAVAVVSAPAAEQRRRALARPGMTADKLDAILARQVPDEEKRRRADFVIDTVKGLECGWVGGGLLVWAVVARSHTVRDRPAGMQACKPLLPDCGECEHVTPPPPTLCTGTSPSPTHPAPHSSSAQGAPLEETRQHVAAVVEALRGRPGRRYAELAQQAASASQASSGQVDGS
jgi:dephospho-CoA kinase